MTKRHSYAPAAALSRNCKRHGVTLDQWALLATLAEAEGMTCTELAALLGVSTASITGRIDALEDILCVYRGYLPGDRRVIKLEITELGRRLLTLVEGGAA